MMSQLYVDTNIFIYLLEETALATKVADQIASFIADGGNLVTSVATLTELIAGAVQDASANLHRMTILEIVQLDAAIAEQAGLLRRKHALKAVDAFHLATALQHEASQLFTNDRPFAKIASQYIEIMGV